MLILLSGVDGCEQPHSFPFARFSNLLEACGLVVNKQSRGTLSQILDSGSDIFLRQLKDLAWASVPMSYLTKRKSSFIYVTLLPKIIQTINEQFGRDIRLFFSPKDINRLTLPRRPLDFAFSHFDNELKLYQWAIEIVFLNVAFTAPRRNVGMQKRVEVLFKGCL